MRLQQRAASAAQVASRVAAPVAALLVALSAACGAPARADDLDAGRAKARACAVCHGPLGVAVAPDAPNLAGQPEQYLSTQLKAYRSGVRRHEVMSLMARPLTDEDIGQLAVWFSAIKVEATAPR